MPYDLTRLQSDIAQLQHDAAGFGTGPFSSNQAFLAPSEFGKQPLALSGLVLTSAFARLVPTAGAVPLLKDALPGPPTATRAFYPFDTLALFAEIYDGEATPHTPQISERKFCVPSA